MSSLFLSIRCVSCLRKYKISKYSLRSFSSVLCETVLKPATLLPPNYIPEPPAIPVQVPESFTHVIQELNALGEPTLHSLGLASWWPPGLVQTGLEHLHVGLDIPWWQSIVVGTLILRLLSFPLTIVAQRNAAKQHNTMPIIQFYQKKFSDAQKAGDILEASRYANFLVGFTKEHNISPLKSALIPFLQMPIFISVFIGLRKMANLPVESMTTGGYAWFNDLTIADPYFLLPIITTVTLFTTLELGVDGMKAKSLSPTARNVMRAIPIIIFPFMMNFPSCLLVYWCTSNFFSLLQVSVMRFKKVKTILKIPDHKPIDSIYTIEKKPFMAQIKETWKKTNKMISVEERMKQEAIRFKEAGMGSVKKTYDYDPTKVKRVQ